MVHQTNQRKEGSRVFASNAERNYRISLTIFLFLNYQKVSLESQNLIKLLLLTTKNQDLESEFSFF